MTDDAAPARRADRARPRPHAMPFARPARAVAALSVALALGACMLHDERPVALAAPEPPVKLARDAAVPDVKTVRRPTPDVKTVHPSEAALAEDAGPTTSATPTPQQIFDFHPAGSHADSWRQPFIIDPNDGPLAAEVRRSAAELKDFLALPKVDGKAESRTAAQHRCGETDIARAKPGCASGPATRAAAQTPASTIPAAAR